MFAIRLLPAYRTPLPEFAEVHQFWLRVTISSGYAEILSLYQPVTWPFRGHPIRRTFARVPSTSEHSFFQYFWLRTLPRENRAGDSASADKEKSATQADFS
jgi:hypothetical protein